MYYVCDGEEVKVDKYNVASFTRKAEVKLWEQEMGAYQQWRI
jgi:hypothetical protein